MNYDEQEKLIAQRKAQYQQQQAGGMPQARMIGNRYVSPNALEYLAQGLRQYGGMRGEQMADQELKDLQTQKQEAMQADQAAMINALRGTPEKTISAPSPFDTEGAGQFTMPKQEGSMQAFYDTALKSQFPQFQQLGMQGMLEMPKLEAQQKAREEDRAFRQQEAQAARDARAEELRIKLEDQRTSQAERLAAQKELREMQIQGQKDLQRMIVASRPAPQPQQAQTLQTENGMLERVNGKWQPITVDGKPVMPKGAGGAGGGNATEGERKAATLLQRMQNSEAQLEAALKTNPNAAKPGIIQQGLSSIGMGTTANLLTPEARQQVEAAQLDILDSALTLGTGAAYTKEQLEGYRKSYFPQIGDKPQTIKDKQDRLNNVLSAARIAAGRAAGQVTAPPPPSGIDALLEKYK